MAGAPGKLFQVLELHPPVALAERGTWLTSPGTAPALPVNPSGSDRRKYPATKMRR